MGAALEAAGELSLIAAGLVALGLVLVAEVLVRGMLGPLTHIPYVGGGIITSAENGLLSGLHALNRRLSHWLVSLYTGLLDSLELLLGSVLLAFLALALLVKWLYEQATSVVGHAAVAKIQRELDDEQKKRQAADAAAAAALAAERALREQLAREVHATTAPAVRAIATETIPKLQAEVTKLERAIVDLHAVNLGPLSTEIHRVEHDLGLLSSQVGTLQSEITVLEHPATAPRPSPIPAPIPAPIPVPGAQGLPGERGAPGETGARGEPGAAGEAAPAGGGTIDLPGLGTLTLAGAVAATYTAVQVIADEAGLGRADCRSKVKGICSTDPSAWAGLLAGLAAVGFAFNLRQLYEVAEPLVAELAPVVSKAA